MTSKIVDKCQICATQELKSIFFVGFLPPVNRMRPIGERPAEESSYPAELLLCEKCQLVQLGLQVAPTILFPKEYPYTSSTTKVLRENFAELYREATQLMKLGPEDLVIDIGSNDGNLLSNFKSNHKVLGITPEDIGKIAVERGIPTLFRYFGKEVVSEIKNQYGKAKLITATNVFAHMEDIHEVVEAILAVLTEDGVFISESHYLLPLVQTLQYDTIYHEHLRYYSLQSISYLLNRHGLEVFYAKPIETHGGSIRVYAARKGQQRVSPNVAELLNKEKPFLNLQGLLAFRESVVQSKLALMAVLREIKLGKKSICGISAPSRASTLINYVGIDDGILDAVLEVGGSHKIGKYMPGTMIPVLDESYLFEKQPDYALMLSWHIADELVAKLRTKGFRGKFIIPLPEVRIVE